MTNEEKLDMAMLLLGEDSNGMRSKIQAYLIAAEKEIIAWRYSASSAFASITKVPPEYEMTQIHAVIAGFSQSGAEAQITHSENGISRTFSYPDMLHYIRANVIPYCGVFG